MVLRGYSVFFTFIIFDIRIYNYLKMLITCNTKPLQIEANNLLKNQNKPFWRVYQLILKQILKKKKWDTLKGLAMIFCWSGKHINYFKKQGNIQIFQTNKKIP